MFSVWKHDNEASFRKFGGGGPDLVVKEGTEGKG